MFCYTLAAKCNHPLFPVVEVQEDMLALTLTRWVTVKSIHKHLKKRTKIQIKRVFSWCTAGIIYSNITIKSINYSLVIKIVINTQMKPMKYIFIQNFH